ncbi:MAG TPA: Ig-like domain-containing protein, partial [Nakamurella sp.]
MATLLAVTACGSQGDVVVTVTSTAGAGVTVSGLDSSGAPASESTALNSKVRVSSKPKFGSTDVAPADPVTVTLFSAKIKDMTVTGDDGTTVQGTVSDDKATWSLAQRLAYNTTYTFNGTAEDGDGNDTPFTGTLQTVKPASTPRAS